MTILILVGKESFMLQITEDRKVGTISSTISANFAQDENLQFVAAIDAVESLILAHAMQGIDVKNPAYVKGIETALEAIGNHYGDDY
jgi:hypothetical protein